MAGRTAIDPLNPRRLATSLGLAALLALAAPAAFAGAAPPDGAATLTPSPPAQSADRASPAPAPTSDDAPVGAIAPAAGSVPAAAAAPKALVDAPLPSDVPPASLSPLSLALQGALKAAGARDFKASRPIGAGDWRAALAAIDGFYAARAYAPLWVTADGLTPAGVAALSRLGRADEDGLDLGAFDLPKAPLTGATPERLADADAVLSEAVVAYAMQASGARIVPSRISPEITQRPTLVTPAQALAVSRAPDADAALAAFNPQQKGYVELRAQLARLRAQAPPRSAPIPSGPSLALGMIDPRVPEVRERLGAPAPAAGKNPLAYDLPLAAAVAAFQRAHGLPATGALTPATAEALSGRSVSSPEALLLANMEMWRWEPRAMGDERIEINIPDYTLRLMDGDTLIHQARVIVGKPDTPTPVFSNQVRYLVVNPIWHVPQSIIKKEMEPKLAQDPAYLTERGFDVSEVGKRLIVRQPAGPHNALGRILFMFPNEHAVYLHDTPSRGLFASSRRAFSHGCVRLQQPMRLAELVMGGAASGWTTARLESLIGTKERTVPLPHTIPIHLEYFTEFVDDAGSLQNRADIYGIARRVAGTIARISQD